MRIITAGVLLLPLMATSALAAGSQGKCTAETKAAIHEILSRDPNAAGKVGVGDKLRELQRLCDGKNG